ncbi:hypothetical protein D9M73_100370 [compost metagenome]
MAGTLRRKTKITITTRAMVSSNVNSTSVTDARMVCVRSTRVFTSTVGGIAACRRGIAALMRSTVWITLAPGCLVMASTMDRPLVMVLPAGAAAPA